MPIGAHTFQASHMLETCFRVATGKKKQKNREKNTRLKENKQRIWDMTGYLNTTPHVVTFYTVQVGTTARHEEVDTGKSHMKNQVWAPAVTLLSLSYFPKNGRNSERMFLQRMLQMDEKIR